MARDWAVCHPREFLGSTEAEASFVELKLTLADNLRRRRLKRGPSQSRVAKMEAGDRSVSLDLLVRSLLTVGMTRRELAKRIATPTRDRAA